MTDKDAKELCKFMIDNNEKPLTQEEKEIFKLAIDNSNTIGELMTVAFMYFNK